MTHAKNDQDTMVQLHFCQVFDFLRQLFTFLLEILKMRIHVVILKPIPVCLKEFSLGSPRCFTKEGNDSAS